MNNSTLKAGSEIDARFAIQKAGWDGTPREWLSSDDVLARPIWDIGFSPDAFDIMENPIAHVTNFPGEGPKATIRFRKYLGEDVIGHPRTVSADTLDDLFNFVVASCLEMEKWVAS
tara:strand:- start:527 stop:874 length:348 start_codon:yes stop_codon:yes gene_type:complete